MNLIFFFGVCCIWATVSVAKMDKMIGLGRKINKLNKDMAILKKHWGKITELHKKIDGFNKRVAILNKNNDELVTGMGTNINKLNKGLMKFNGLNNGLTILNKVMKKLITKEAAVGRDCADICRKGGYPSGVYKIRPNRKTILEVYCDMKTAGGGWTVFQKRVDSSVDFYKTWNEYKIGFGSLKKNLWLGNDKIHLLTHIAGRTQVLRVNLWDKKGNTRYAQYSKFLIDTEANKYKLTVGKYSGNGGNSLGPHNGAAFSTKDKDNDTWSGKCAVTFKGAWWYNSCHYSNLNGKYHNGKHSSYADGINWYHWKGHKYSYPRVEMMMRPATFKGCKK